MGGGERGCTPTAACDRCPCSPAATRRCPLPGNRGQGTGDRGQNDTGRLIAGARTRRPWPLTPDPWPVANCPGPPAATGGRVDVDRGPVVSVVGTTATAGEAGDAERKDACHGPPALFSNRATDGRLRRPQGRSQPPRAVVPLRHLSVPARSGQGDSGDRPTKPAPTSSGQVGNASHALPICPARQWAPVSSCLTGSGDRSGPAPAWSGVRPPIPSSTLYSITGGPFFPTILLFLMHLAGASLERAPARGVEQRQLTGRHPLGHAGSSPAPATWTDEG